MKKLILLLAAFVLLVVAAGCGDTGAREQGKDSGSRLVYASHDYTRINPAIDEHGEINLLLFNGLTMHDDKGKVVPGLAEKWDFDEAANTYTFHLRKDVKWHDGKPFTAKELAEALVKFDLVVDKIGISGVIVPLNEIIVAASGDIRVALFIVEVVHLIEPVIHISCAKLPAAVDHVEKYPHPGLARLLVDILDLGVHRLIVHARNAPNQILYVRHRAIIIQ